MENRIHEGRNLKRLREMLGIKQEALAMSLGEDWNQKKISLLEQKETIEPIILQQLSIALKIPIPSFREFDPEIVLLKLHQNLTEMSPQSSIYPFQQIIEIYENKIIVLYERMLACEREKVEIMKEMVSRIS
jgi:transcriptional regulator with XRE-family HTH domain